MGDRASREIIKLKGGHYGWTLIQSEWCPYKEEIKTQTHRVKTMEEDGYEQSRKASEETFLPTA